MDGRAVQWGMPCLIFNLTLCSVQPGLDLKKDANSIQFSFIFSQYLRSGRFNSRKNTVNLLYIYFYRFKIVSCFSEEFEKKSKDSDVIDVIVKIRFELVKL